MIVMEPKTDMLWLFAALAVLFIISAGCTGTIPAQPASPVNEKTPVGVSANSTRAVADANNRFAFDLYSRLARNSRLAGSNIFFSPFSISSALAITYEGANGKTANEIRSVFYFPADNTQRREGFTGLNAGINRVDTAYSLHTANAMWAEKTHPFLAEYTTTAERYYGANTTNLDFKNQPEESRITINQWVENETENRIRNLVPAGAIDTVTKLVITNAIYFKGSWVKEFDKNKTVNTAFTTGSGNTVQVPMMQRTDEKAVYRYAETGDLQILSMPYEHAGGRELSMIVLLPKGNNLTAAEESMSADRLSALSQTATSRRVMVYFPKIKLETEYHLPETLAAMGMPTAFSGAADFSGMDGTQDLYINDVIHKTYLDVNEEGTEAAAATAVILRGKGMAREEPVPIFRADHPFVFLIEDTETGNILFMGRVTNPVSS